MAASDTDFGNIIDYLGPSDLRNLYHELGIRTPDIKKCEIDAGPGATVNLQARAVLESWRQKNGSDATRQAILEALKRCGLKQAKEHLEERWGSTCQSEEQQQENILKRCQEHLQRYYLDSLCKIPMILSENQFINLKDIYTNISININLPEPCGYIKVPLNSYNEIFTRKTDEGFPVFKLLIAAPAGLGKTTLSAKIAYDWATKAEESPLKDVDLVFVLNMRVEDHTSNLEDAILSQLLPEGDITTLQIKNCIDKLEKNIVIVLDSLDESDRELYKHSENIGSILKLLTGKILPTCRLIVMTRPWRISEITNSCNAFTHFVLEGFTKEHLIEYIGKFFRRKDPSLGDSLIEYLNQNELIVKVTTAPLNALLVCTYWFQVKGLNTIPNRIGLFYDAIINVMHRHHSQKQGSGRHSQECNGDIRLFVIQLGEMALKGFWPPENRIVFSPTEVSSSQVVDNACKIGLINKQESHPSVLSHQKQASLTFIHKTYGEKCAGEYLASLADNNPDMLASYLLSLKTIDEVLSIKFILQFACGANSITAKDILRRLMKIFESEYQEVMSDYYKENLGLEDTQKIQRFIDVCLYCNYEADRNSEFSTLLMKLFPKGRVYFLGIPAFTPTALGYYLSYCQPGQIQSIVLRPIVHPGVNIRPTGLLRKVTQSTDREVRRISLGKMRTICKEYFEKYNEKHPSGVHKSTERIASRLPALTVSRISVWQACENLIPLEASSIGPILSGLSQHSTLKVFDISHFQIGNKIIDKLLEIIDKGHMSHLIELRVSTIGMSGHQTERLANVIKQIPLLRVFDVSGNTARQSLPIMIKSLHTSKSLKTLDIDDMWASVDCMNVFAQKFPGFGSTLVEMHINGNKIDDRVASHLAKHLPIAILLEDLSIGVNDLSRKCHNQLLRVMRQLPQLHTLKIYRSQYPDDLMVSVADVLESMPHLNFLLLGTSRNTPPKVSNATWLCFKTKLQKTTKLKSMQLYHIALDMDDFLDVVSVCRQKAFKRLRYHANCLPDEVEVPQDDFFGLL